MAEQRSVPPGIDVTTPSVARMYDYYLGGKDNFAADREAADKVLTALPEAGRAARSNRAFLGRAVRYLAAEAGIRQFIDLGTGLPTADNVHQVAQSVAPDARVVYVDNDPIVLAHGRALLADNASTIVIQADLRQPGQVLAHPELTALIDLSQPVAVLFVAVLHFIVDADDPPGIVARFRETMAPGSYVVISHGTADAHADEVTKAAKAYDGATSQGVARTRAQVERLFEGFELVEPGLVYIPEWRPDEPDPSAQRLIYGGVGRKP